jgi:hypothetical protein
MKKETDICFKNLTMGQAHSPKFKTNAAWRGERREDIEPLKPL